MADTIFSELPEISFVNTDSATVEAEIFASYTTLTGRTLAVGDPVAMIFKAIASRIIQERVNIDQTGKSQLLSYAKGDYLDYLGEFRSLPRLTDISASCNVRFTLSEAQSTNITIPAGTRVTDANGELYFAATESVIIIAGNTSGETAAECQTTGEAGNGILIGKLNVIVDPVPFVESVMNITETAGGSDIEDDINYRDRIYTALERFSVAGAEGAYRALAKSANPEIVDVVIYSPSAGVVEIRPLMRGGEMPSDEILDAIDAICSASDKRPLTDYVQVLAPIQVTYNVDLTYYVDQKDISNAESIGEAVTTAVNEFIEWQKSAVGRDINPSELIYKVMSAGVKRVIFTSPSYTVLSNTQVAKEGTVTITEGAVELG